MADNNSVNKSAAMSVKPRESRLLLLPCFPPQTADNRDIRQLIIGKR